jgi:uncharacterized protein (TIGR03435 family)
MLPEDLHIPPVTTLHSERRLNFAPALAAFLAMALAAIPALSQAKPQAFEAVSIRLEDSHTSQAAFNDPSSNQPQHFPSNRFIMRHIMLRSLICEAYGIQCNYVLEGPDWIDRQHYDLIAKVEGTALLTQEQMQPLMQNLLQERFHLVAHRQQKVVPGFALVIAKGGPKLQPNKGAPAGGFFGGPYFKFQNMSVEHFSKVLESPVKKPIVDKTGLTGMYDFDLKYAPTDAAANNPAAAGLPDIFTVLQEQLGLKLVPQPVTIKTLIIDHVDKIPTEN